MAKRMAAVQTALGESRDAPAGDLTVNATIGVGTVWLIAQLAEFVERHPEIRISLIIGDSDVDLSMREADVAIRVRAPDPARPDPAPADDRPHPHLWLAGLPRPPRRAGDVRGSRPPPPGRLRRHRPPPVQPQLGPDRRARGRRATPAARSAALEINNVFGMLRAAESGLGLASLPDYLAGGERPAASASCRTSKGPSFTAYFVYPEELKTSKRVGGIPRLPAGEGGRAAGLVSSARVARRFAWRHARYATTIVGRALANAARRSLICAVQHGRCSGWSCCRGGLGFGVAVRSGRNALGQGGSSGLLVSQTFSLPDQLGRVFGPGLFFGPMLFEPCAPERRRRTLEHWRSKSSTAALQQQLICERWRTRRRSQRPE